MSRPLRIEYPDAVYHVMNRGLNQRRIFKSKKDYELFLSTLDESCQFFNGIIYSYCLMPNHYHVLLCTPSGNLSRFMRHLNGVYTQRFNREHRRDGPLFRGRFKGILVQEDSYLLEVVRYIHKNPLKAKMVENLNQFKWCSHKFYLGHKSSLSGLDREFALKYFSRNRKKSIELYKRFMSSAEDEAIEKFYSSRKQGSILGDMDFIEHIKEKYILGDPSSDMEVGELRKIRGEKVIRRIKKEVCKVFKVKDKHLLSGQRGVTNISRQMAILLSKELSGLKHSEISSYFNARSSRAVRAHCLRLQAKMTSDKSLKKSYINLRTTCGQVAT